MEITTIKANIEHLALLTPLFDGYRVFYKQKSDIEKAKAFLKMRFELQDSVIFMAMQKAVDKELQEQSEAIGFTQLYPYFSSVTMERLYILNDLFVLPSKRGLGMGELLLKKAQQFAIDIEAKGLDLSTAIDNPAQKLYERLGWKKDVDFYSYNWRTQL